MFKVVAIILTWSVLLFSSVFSSAQANTQKGLIYCSESDIYSMNPQRYALSTTASTISYAVYDRLLTMNPDTKDVGPGIGYLEAIKNNRKTYIFKISKKVQFHSNKLFTPSRLLNAEDVAFSFDRLINKDNPFYRPESDFPFIQGSEIIYNLNKVEALDNDSVAFYLKEPSSELIGLLASDNAVILSKEYADFILKNKLPLDTLDQNAIGSGPYLQAKFMFKRFVRLNPFMAYHGPKPKLPSLILLHSTYTNKRLTQLFTGECHVITNPTPNQMILIESVKDKMNIINRNSLIGTFLIFNTKNEFFKDKETRRAIASLLNLSEINQMVFFGRGSLQNDLNIKNFNEIKNIKIEEENKVSTLPDHISRFTENKEYKAALIKGVTEEEKQNAIKLLKKANGISLFVFERNNLGFNNHIKIAQIIKSDLEQYGIKVNIRTFRSNYGLKRMHQGNFDMALINVFSDYNTIIEPLVKCHNYNKKNTKDFSQNFTKWCNKDVDILYESIHDMPSSSEKIATLNEINEILYSQMPLVPLIYSNNKFVALNKVKGTEATPYGGMSFINAYLEP